MADFMEGMETPEELYEKQRAYDEQKRKAAIYGSIADNLSNRQSLGSIMLGRNVGGFTPSKAVEAGFGPSGASPDEEYKQRLSGLLTRSQMAKAQREEAQGAEKVAQSKLDAEKLGKLTSGLGKQYGLGSSEGLSVEGQKQYRELLEKVITAREAAAKRKSASGGVDGGVDGGGKVVPAGQMAALAGAGAGLDTLRKLEKDIKEGSASYGPILGRLRSLNPWDTSQRLAESSTKQAAQTIGTYLEGGKLAEGDIARYRDQLPGSPDTEDVALGKSLQLREKIIDKLRQEITALSDRYDVSPLQKKLKEEELLLAQDKQKINPTPAASDKIGMSKAKAAKTPDEMSEAELDAYIKANGL